MRLALAQINPLVGDLTGNGAQLLEACQAAASQGADLVIAPELALWGYPPRDLLLRPALRRQQQQVLDQLAEQLPEGLALLLGVSEPASDGQQPDLFNSAALVERGHWRIVARKRLLPSYDVFDERRYFRPADAPCLLELQGGGRPWRLGITICEDLWVEEELHPQRLLGADPVADLQALQPDLLINLSASPFGDGKAKLRRELAAAAARRLHCPVAYVNQVGGNDELVFDGGSFVATANGDVPCQLAFAKSDLHLWDATPAAPGASPQATPELPDPNELLVRTLVLGVRDYARKCGFGKALLGLSGGIDSALVAVIAAAALGPDNVQALLMPSPWSSLGSINDSLALANRLGMATHTVPIEALMNSFDSALTPPLGGAPAGLTAENLQSRIRGTLLMAVANQQGQLLLATGNKSELAVGYCTLYGDMNGGLAVIGDLYKTGVFRLCAWLDSTAAAHCRQELGLPPDGELVGRAIRDKPPSAELRPDQRDSDSLPDYSVLDPLLEALLEQHLSPDDLVARGVDRAQADRVMQLLRRAEFKRRQAPPVLKLGKRSFGSGWRMPIAAA
ncbi:NAD+ synthase [Synechococcus sp. HK05]|uniref:NAD+ synthase n=1 Tax=Synechococcus sp. HK05 TaxID=2725975 RepID=UPI001C393163|nr:NAD+ synthase [Synechococcus sp. HK05]MBV2350149.1 NAD+ synthase [Synechococcus sp. HK05]